MNHASRWFSLHRIRAEEKYLLERLEKQPGIEVVLLADGDHFFNIAKSPSTWIWCLSVPSLILVVCISRAFLKRTAFRSSTHRR